MKTKNIIFYLIGLLVLCSCDDMFTPADENTRQEDAMYQESQYAYGLLMYGYNRLPYRTTTETDIATDDATTNVTNNNIYNMATGAWASDNNPVSMWTSCKDGIQYVNKFLTIVEKTKWSPSTASKNQMFIDRMKGEAFGLRAIFYYHLLQAHGGYADDGILYGVPLLTSPEDASSDFNQPRATFADCVKQIYADCDSAMALLPMDYTDIMANSEIPQKYINLGAEYSNYNLVFGLRSRNLLSARVAEAVKAQVALLASSPAFRDQSGVTSADAALLCANVLKHNNGMEGFDPTGNLDWYSNTYKNMIDTNVPEILWRPNRSDNATQEKSNFPPSLNGNGLVNPSQNLVDAYPMNNGLPITDPNSGYDPKNPYANRDLRLTNTIVYNGSGFSYKKVIITTGLDMPYGDKMDKYEDNINQNSRSTRTGYYLKKLLREDVSVMTGELKQKHLSPRIRYTEIYLAYAEAANEAWGPNADPTGVGFTAYDVIKAIRERAGLGKDEYGRPLAGGDQYLAKVKDDKEKMTELIRNERRLELCFENKRFWDLRRWLMPLDEDLKGVEITDPNRDGVLQYKYFTVDERKFKHKNNSYQWYGPIPKDETLRWSKLKQNKGWQ